MESFNLYQEDRTWLSLPLMFLLPSHLYPFLTNFLSSIFSSNRVTLHTHLLMDPHTLHPLHPNHICHHRPSFHHHLPLNMDQVRHEFFHFLHHSSWYFRWYKSLSLSLSLMIEIWWKFDPVQLARYSNFFSSFFLFLISSPLSFLSLSNLFPSDYNCCCFR